VAEAYDAWRIDGSRYHALVEELQKPFEDFMVNHKLPRLRENYHVQMICCSGTVTTLGAIYKRLPRYDRRQVDGITLTRSQVNQTIDELLALPFEELRDHPCVGSERADFLMAGCSI